MRARRGCNFLPDGAVIFGHERRLAFGHKLCAARRYSLQRGFHQRRLAFKMLSPSSEKSSTSRTGLPGLKVAGKQSCTLAGSSRIGVRRLGNRIGRPCLAKMPKYLSPGSVAPYGAQLKTLVLVMVSETFNVADPLDIVSTTGFVFRGQGRGQAFSVVDPL